MQKAPEDVVREWTVGTVDSLKNENNQALYDYWSGQRDSDKLPARGDIDPVDMRFILGHILIVDVLRDPLNFQYRLVGSGISTDLGFDLTGQKLTEHPDPTYRRFATEIYTRVVETVTPLVVQVDAMIDGRIRRYEAVVLPLAVDGETVDAVLVGQCPLS